ncbi:MAG: patatin-like phospholipase family protein, partial [Caulobacteraceae bacterium]
GTQKIHRQGLVREALRASLSLPGVLPPVTDGDDILVDGAVLNNFPTDIMRTLHEGPVIGVDVGTGRSIGAAEIAGPSSALHWVSSGGWREGAPIVSILIRAATITAHHQTSAAHELADVLIQPKLDDVEIGDWRAYEPAVAAGRRATLEALDALDRPVTELGLVASTQGGLLDESPDMAADRPMA